MRRLWTPSSVHYISLPLAFVVILLLARDQWFFGDDWAILAPSHDGQVLVPHVGHLNLIPALVFPLIRDLVGLQCYLPFLVPALLAHLAVAHLSWRICLRVGTTPWIATLLGLFVMFLGAGAENIFWAFQFGFMGAIALGLLAVLLMDFEHMTPARAAIIVAAATLAPTFSGTAIPVLAAAAIVGWMRHGVRSVLLLIPAAALYLTWYFTIAASYPSPASGIQSGGDALSALLYAGAMYGGGLGRALPWIGLGVIPAIGIAVWFFATVRKGLRTRRSAAYAMIIGSVAFVVLTTWSRHAFGITAAATPRYAYLTIVLLLPATALVLSSLAARSGRWKAVSAISIAVLIFTNVAFLIVDARAQALREQASRARVMVSLELVIERPNDSQLLDLAADPEWATDLLGSDLLRLYHSGQISPP